MLRLLSHSQIKADRLGLANQPDTVVVDEGRKTAVVIDVVVPTDSNIRKEEDEKLEKYHSLKEEPEKKPKWSQ